MYSAGAWSEGLIWYGFVRREPISIFGWRICKTRYTHYINNGMGWKARYGPRAKAGVLHKIFLESAAQDYRNRIRKLNKEKAK